MKKRRTLLQPLMFALNLAVIASGTAWVVSRSEQPASPIEQKFAEAERLRCYALRRRGPAPRFLLSGRERRLRLISHAVFPSGAAFDPEKEVLYGIRFSLRSSDGKKRWERDVYQKSRQSKAQRTPFGFRYENAFVPSLDVEVSDDRLLEVDLPGETPARSTLTLEPLGVPSEILLRLYNRVDRVPLAGPPAMVSLTPVEREQMALARVDLPWDRLGRAERDTILKHKWERMGAEGQEGEDFATRIVYYTGLRFARAALHELELTPLWPTNDLAFNVRGPASFLLAVTADPLAARSKRDQDVEVERRSADGTSATAHVPLRVGFASATARVEVPAGVHTLVVRTRGDSALRASMSGGPGGLPQPGFSAAPGAGTDGLVIPDVKRIRTVIAQPDGAPVLIRVEPDADLMARTLRIDVRVPITSGRPESSRFDVDAEGLATLTLTMRDASGVATRTLELPVRAPRSRFERALYSDSTASDVTEPVALRVIVPSGVTLIELRASRAVHARLLTLTDEPNELDLPYQELASELMTLRYATNVRRTYWPFLPDNHQALSEQGRVGTVVAQVRLEAQAAPAAAVTELETRSVLPLGQPESHAILESVPADKRELEAAAWEPGSWTELRVGRGTAIVFGRRASARASLSFQTAMGAESSSLGQPVTVRVDDQVMLELDLRETRGAVTLPPIAPGPHRIQISTPATGTRWQINQPPANPSAAVLYRNRTVFDLRPGRALRVRAERRGGGPPQLYMIVYARERDAVPGAQFRVRIDEGQPQRVEGALVQTLTRPDRPAQLGKPFVDTQAEFVDLRGVSAGYPRQLLIGFGDDVAAGPHRVEITNIGHSAVWARFFELGATSPGRERAVQRTTTVDDAGEGE